ncbi:MAG: CocE/NonD family hydrolase [Thermomicrobium sp.]|nr:CocE/NonD family hydrolase [Thermomicrobium sp.]MDW7982365.1 CocE/NonD family hydrolase [Thermomicrobium sp.]
MGPYRFMEPLERPDAVGIQGPSPDRRVEGDLLIERDVSVMLRDGTRIYADLFRPVSGEQVPALLAWGPYGKHEGTLQYLVRAFPSAGVREEDVGPYAMFEGPDPHFWVPHGYAVVNVNPRGVWYSEGTAIFIAEEEAHDCYDCIEWIARQPWCTGRVGMTGVSYLANIQWRVAALEPPHLAAINPWEGWSDTYREFAYHGGIPETWFWPYWTLQRLPVGSGLVEDLFTEAEEHPLWDSFWASKAAQLERIRIPAYVVASWADHGLHTRGTLEGFRRIRSQDKWLEVHGDKKWAYYYRPESRARQLAFFDRFLKERRTEVEEWPTVRAFVRQAGTTGEWRTFETWPVSRARPVRLFLYLERGQLVDRPPTELTTRWYLVTSGGVDRRRRPLGRLVCDYQFPQAVEIVGPMRLHLWVAALDADDADLFVGVQKLDREGGVVTFPHYAQYDDGPVALGWLRISHRDLDPVRSTDLRPVHRHEREEKVRPGEPVAVDIEIWPSGTRFEPGETLRLIVQGRDIQDYPPGRVYARHERTVNRGRHQVLSGGRYVSFLVVPIVGRE